MPCRLELRLDARVLLEVHRAVRALAAGAFRGGEDVRVGEEE
jgi:hypothetical protein